MTLQEWQNSGKYFNYHTYKIYYRQGGEGNEYLCLIHGFPTSSFDWYKVWDKLAERYNIIAPDMIGFGFSDKPQSYQYSMMDQANIHEELLRNKEIGSVHILAHDYGDTVAQELLARYEDRLKEGKKGLQIKSICFLNGGLFPETHRAKPIQKLLLSPLGFILSGFYGEKQFRKTFSEIFGKATQPTEQEYNDFWEILNLNDGRKVMHKLIRYITERKQNRERWVGALQKTQVPMRVINGTIDPVSGLHMTVRYKELVPNPDVYLLEEIGHYPQVEDPEGVLKGYFEFVK